MQKKEEFPLFSVAPMMDYTDRHQRTLMRLISRKTTLYTEMITTNALVRSGNIEVRGYLYTNSQYIHTYIAYITYIYFLIINSNTITESRGF